MEANVFLISLLVFVTFEFQKTTATIPGITLTMTDGGNQGDKTTATCSLKMDELETSSHTSAMKRGDNGAKGIPGINGLPGPKGSKGEQGLPGLDGIPGPKGIKGDQGFPGADGIPGVPGPDGHMLAEGNIGAPGLLGFPGIQGKMGEKGDCDCISADNFGTEESPATVTCKSAPPGVFSGTYYMGPPAQPFEVFCNMETKETCILEKEYTTPWSSFKKGKEWISSKIRDETKNALFYKNLSTDQITWLQKRSATARQRLSYKCKRDYENVKDFNVSSTVLLLTWNDMVIGSNRSEYPFSYSVPHEYDDCLNGFSNNFFAWGDFGDKSLSYQTLIDLKTTNVNRLPITDMWLDDIGDIEEWVSIQNIELCFR